MFEREAALSLAGVWARTAVDSAVLAEEVAEVDCNRIAIDGVTRAAGLPVPAPCHKGFDVSRELVGCALLRKKGLEF